MLSRIVSAAVCGLFIVGCAGWKETSRKTLRTALEVNDSVFKAGHSVAKRACTELAYKCKAQSKIQEAISSTDYCRKTQECIAAYKIFVATSASIDELVLQAYQAIQTSNEKKFKEVWARISKIANEVIDYSLRLKAFLEAK
jgi:hypothetical protein